jgi:hypothetical protein
MKPYRILSVVASLGLMAAFAPVAATAAAAPAPGTAPAAAQVVQLTLIQTLCPSYTVVPANKTPANFDLTGGHFGELATGFQTVLTDPTTDIPSVCIRTDGWQYQLYGDPGLSVLVGSPTTTGTDGVGTGAVTVTLNPAEIALAQTTGAPTGLWVTAITQPGVAGFGALRCYTDINNGDDRENITNIGAQSLHMYCIAYSVLAPGASYHPLTPTRLLDTRNGTGLSGPFSSHVARTFQVTGGVVPAGATAVTGNLTVTGQSSSGYLFIGPTATNNPTSSTLNFPVADDRANAVTSGLGGGGTLSITYVAPTVGPTAQVVFDVSGYFTADTSGATYHPLTPTRLLDTRDGTGGISSPLSSHVAATFQVTGGVVPSSASAVTGNLTVTGQTNLGFLFIGPTAVNDPTSSTLNFPLADDRANGVTVALGSGGTLSVTYAAPTLGPTAQVIFDVTGYFTPDTSGAFYVPLAPARILDTRNGTGGISSPLSSHSAQSFGVRGAGGVASIAIAVTGNLTVTNQTSNGYLFIGPVATNDPTSSTLNFPLGDDRANGVTVALNGTTGSLSVTFVAPSPGHTANAVFDVGGYFVSW